MVFGACGRTFGKGDRFCCSRAARGRSTATWFRRVRCERHAAPKRQTYKVVSSGQFSAESSSVLEVPEFRRPNQEEPGLKGV